LIERGTAGVKRLFGAADRRRSGAFLLVVVCAAVVSLVLVNDEEPSRVTAAPALPAAEAMPPDDPAPAAASTTVPAQATGTEAPGKQYAPLRIQIPAIGASAPVDPLGLNRDGTLAVPTDFARAGYYTGRPVPGAKGPAIIVAHVDSKSGPAVFKRLRELKPGDEVVVTRADQSDVIFVVDRVESHPKNRFPTNAVYDLTSDATLRLITCGGSFDRRAGHYRDNVIAFAHYKSLTPAGTV
jgi:sortase (surface protein transpeptidase)